MEVGSLLKALKNADPKSLQQQQLVFTAFGRVAVTSRHCRNTWESVEDGTFEALFERDDRGSPCAWENMITACVKELKRQVKKPKMVPSTDGTDQQRDHYEPGQSDNGPQYRVGWTPLTAPAHSRQYAPVGQQRKDAVHRFTSFVNRNHRKLKVWSTPSSAWFAPELTQADVLALLEGRADGSFLVHMYEPGIASQPGLASDPDPDPRTSYSITVARDSILDGTLSASADDRRRSASHWTGTIVQDDNQWFQLLEAPDRQAKSRFAVQGVGFDSYNALTSSEKYEDLLDRHVHADGSSNRGGSGAATENKVSSLALLVDRYAQQPYQLPCWKLSKTQESSTIFGALKKDIRTKASKFVEKYKGMIYEAPTWACERCTFLNTLDRTTCEMCGGKRGSGAKVDEYTPPWTLYRSSIVVIRTMSVLMERAESAFVEFDTPDRRGVQAAEAKLKDVVTALLAFKIAIDKDTFEKSVGYTVKNTGQLIDVVLDQDNVEVHSQPGTKAAVMVGQDYGVQAELDAALVRIVCSFPEHVASLLSNREIKNPKQRSVLGKMITKIRPTLNDLMTEGARNRFDEMLNAHAWS